MEDFFYSSYKGFYCALCDGDNQQFFDTKNNTIIFSEKFCRDIVENTLPSLLFFKVDLVQYTNLVTKFLVSCDNKGNYNMNAVLPQSLLFVEHEQEFRQLTQCSRERNNVNWFVYCEKVCEKFELATYPNFFEPNAVDGKEKSLVKRYASFLDDQIGKVRHGGKGGGFLEQELMKNKNHKNHKNHKNKKHKKIKRKKERKLEKEIQQDPSLVYTSGMQSIVFLKGYKSKFKTVGISLFDSGKNSLISKSMYNEIKMDIKKDRFTQNAKAKPEPIQRQLISGSALLLILPLLI